MAFKKGVLIRRNCFDFQTTGQTAAFTQITARRLPFRPLQPRRAEQWLVAEQLRDAAATWDHCSLQDSQIAACAAPHDDQRGAAVGVMGGGGPVEGGGWYSSERLSALAVKVAVEEVLGWLGAQVFAGDDVALTSFIQGEEWC
jgi:hypothetical protein